MLRGSLALLVLLGVGEGLASAQATLPPPSLPTAISQEPDPQGGQPPTTLGASPDASRGTSRDEKGKGDQAAGQPSQPGTCGTAAQGQATQGQSCGSEGGSQLSEEERQRAALRRHHSGPEDRIWVRGGFLLWWLQDAPAPGPLVTTGPAVSAGTLGNPDTTVLFGNDRFDFGDQPGVFLEGGVWLDECHHWGVSASAFLLERQSQGALFQSDGAGVPLLARPFTNAITTQESSLGVSVPGTAAGSIGITTNTQLWGAEANLIRSLQYTPEWDIQVLAGFRYLSLWDDLNIFHNQVLLQTTAGQPAGLNQVVADRFTTRNQLYLGQVGGKIEWARGPVFVGLTGKVGLGPNHQRVRNLGSTTTTTPGVGSASFPGGLLAVPGTPVVPGGNQGVFTTNWFVVVPEVGVEVGLAITERLRVAAGYNFLFINNVARPGSQINRTINPALVPSSVAFGSPSGPGQPSPLTKQDDFWAHGVRVMLELRF
ncbi:MAG: BBP7 family outer membrane beta-barrel protein [Gemmataceae bacterium]|nr:BBP7 family outer membrane beta-barrel protein [Gemmataceae bacterium]